MSISEFRAKTIAGIWSMLCVAPVYLLSLIFQPLKKVIKDFESIGEGRSILIISAISGIVFTFAIFLIVNHILQERLNIFFIFLF